MLVHILVVVLFVNRWIGADDLLSKFHQNTYKIRDYRVEVLSYDKSFFNKAHVITFKYNRTTTAINTTINLKQDISLKRLEVLVQAYKFASNEYRPFPIRFQKSAYSLVIADVLGFQASLACGNLSDINFYKDVTYHVCNFIPDARLLPPLIPTGQYKVVSNFLYPENEIASSAGYFEIYVPFKYE